MNHVSRHDVLNLDLNLMAIANDDGLQGQGVLQTVDDVTGVVLLNKPNDSVEQQQPTDHAEIHPVLQTGSKQN